MSTLSRSAELQAWAARVLSDKCHRPPDLQQVTERSYESLPTSEPARVSAQRAGISAPAVVLWAGAALAWMSRHDGLTTPRAAVGRLGKQPVPSQVLAVVALLGAAAASAIVVNRLTTPTLQLTEGYWHRCAPSGTAGPRRSVPVQSGWSSVGRSAWNDSRGSAATTDELVEFAHLGQRPRRLPGEEYYLPTRVGNTAEARPTWKYGLNALALWPHLWLLLPDAARGEMGQARAALDSAVATGIWPLAFVCFCFTPRAWWAALAGTGVMLASCVSWLPARAEVYADLVEASSELYRGRWPGVADRKTPAAALERI